MLEMLMTLAIIGVLSCVAVWGLSMSFTKHKANTLIEDVKMAGFIVVDEMFKNMVENEEISMAGHFVKSSEYEFSAFKEPGVGGLSSASFAIVADNVSYKVCMEVKERKMDWLEIIMPNGRVNKCYENDQNSISFFFNTQLNTEETKERECETNADCGTETPFCCAGLCQVNEECECPGGDWRKITNYASDGSESVLGEMCCKTGYNSAVDGMCCDASKPYCKQVSYLGKNSAGNWIDTGYVPKPNTKIVGRMMSPSTINSTIYYGGGGSAHSNELSLYNWEGRIQIHRCFEQQWTLKPNIWFTHINSPTLRQITYDDGVVYKNTTTKRCASNQNSIYLFEYNRGHVSSGTEVVFISYFQIYDEESTLVRDFIPVIDNDGKAGMYDKVSEEIFYNSGTGKFIAGE